MKRPLTEKKSRGTTVAEKERAKSNTFSDEQRQRLMARGLQFIYGEPADVRDPIRMMPIGPQSAEPGVVAAVPLARTRSISLVFPEVP